MGFNYLPKISDSLKCVLLLLLLCWVFSRHHILQIRDFVMFWKLLQIDGNTRTLLDNVQQCIILYNNDNLAAIIAMPLFLNYNVHYNPESVILQRKVWRKSQKTLSLSKNEQISLILFVLTAHTRNVFRTLSNMQDGGFCENS